MNKPPSHRLPSIDAIRGMVMVLMTVDHASYAYNANRYVTDSIAMYEVGSTLPTTQFLLRWVTHLCAPTFVFLAGMAVAYRITRRSPEGLSGKFVDVHLLYRGLFILVLDPVWMSLGFGGRTIFQVLYAIGGGLCCLAFIHRLRSATLLCLGLSLLVGSEVMAGMAIWLGGGEQAGILGVFIATGGRIGDWGYVIYPLMPWLAYMTLGLGCGKLMTSGRIQQPTRWFALAGLFSLALFVVVRGLNGYGNMRLYRDDLSLLQWLHVSKYPPSLSFGLLTLGLMGLLLALFFSLYQRQKVSHRDPFLVFGRVPLFYYLIHVHLLVGSAVFLKTWKKGGIMETFVATGLILALLYPLCRWYAGFKSKYQKGILRYL